MKVSYGIFGRHRRAFSMASLGLSALALVACGTEDEEAQPTEEPTAPVEDTVATGEPEEADEATQVAATAVAGEATPAVSGAATPAVGGLVEASPVASPVTGAASPVADAATPVGAVAGGAEASPDAATPVSGTSEATAAATPIEEEELGTPASVILDDVASPMASPVGSPMASPVATPDDATPAASVSIPVVFFQSDGD